MGGAASILYWCAAVRRPKAWSARCSGALVWARLSAATPAGAGGWGRWGAPSAGPAASPPPASRSLLGEGGASPRLRGGGGSLLWPSSWGGGARGGGWGGRSRAPSGVGLPSVVSRVPPQGYTRAVAVAGRPRSSGAVGRQWVSAAGAGGSGGESLRPGWRPRLPWAGL